MRNWVLVALTVALGCSTAVGIARAQDSVANPFQGNAEAIRKGTALYRVRCADCHGMDARGLRAPDLTQVWASGRTDEGLFNTIRTGVSGTEMPAFRPPRNVDSEVWQILAYVRTLAAPAPTDPPRGDAERGERLFRVNCAGCHRVDATGGRFGPDLSRIGAARSREAIMRRIRGATEEFRTGYEPVTITPQSGAPIHGVKKNEDLFSVQIMDSRERIQGYNKDQVRAVIDEQSSAMPVYGPDRLSDGDLDDLLRYLQGLRGYDPSVQ